MIRFWTPLVVVTMLLVGCGKPEDKFVGTYDGKMEVNQEFIDRMQAAAPEGSPNNIAESLNSMTMKLELKDDGTYALISDSVNGPYTQGGKWSSNPEGDQLTLTSPVKDQQIKDMVADMGLDSSDPMLLFVSDDGQTLSFQGIESGIEINVNFTKR